MMHQKSKILFVGNLANFSYNLAKAMRKNGIRVDLFMNNNVGNVSKPSYIDREVPIWVTYYTSKKVLSNFFEIIRKAKENQYSSITGFYSAAIPLMFCGRDYCIYSMGSDFRETAQKKTIYGLMMKRAFRKAKIFFCCQMDQIPIIKSQKFNNVKYIQQPIIINPKMLPRVTSRGQKLLILHPSNHVWAVKGNDIFLRGLAQYAQTNKNFKCIILKRGEDFQKSLLLIRKLGIEKNIEILDEVSQNKLRELISKSDVVADQFILGSFGMISLESMAMKKPVLIKLHKKFEREFYGENSPVPSMDTPEKISQYLEYLAKDLRNKKTVGEKNFTFVKKHHDSNVVAKKMFSYLSNISNT